MGRMPVPQSTGTACGVLQPAAVSTTAMTPATAALLMIPFNRFSIVRPSGH
jgi:hypothetical protein